jgi:hypothetical protein
MFFSLQFHEIHLPVYVTILSKVLKFFSCCLFDVCKSHVVNHHLLVSSCV